MFESIAGHLPELVQLDVFGLQLADNYGALRLFEFAPRLSSVTLRGYGGYSLQTIAIPWSHITYLSVHMPDQEDWYHMFCVLPLITHLHTLILSLSMMHF